MHIFGVWAGFLLVYLRSGLGVWTEGRKRWRERCLSRTEKLVSCGRETIYLDSVGWEASRYRIKSQSSISFSKQLKVSSDTTSKVIRNVPTKIQ